MGIDDLAARSAGISVQPSPAAGWFTVSSQRSPIAAVQLMDTGGRLLQTMPNNRPGSVIVPVDQLPNGLYVVRVTLVDGTVNHQRVMVANP